MRSRGKSVGSSARKPARSAEQYSLPGGADLVRDRGGESYVVHSVAPSAPSTAPPSYLGILGLSTLDSMNIRRRIEEGLTLTQLELLQGTLGASLEQTAELIGMTPRTLSRRRAAGRLQPEESDHLVRAARVVGAAIELFDGDLDSARQWLNSDQPALGGETPLEVAKTDTGAHEVEHLIGRLEHGVFS